MTTHTDEARIAERLKLYRRLAGMTQRDAADSLDVTEKTIARWESGETTGFMGQLDRIAKVYGVTADDLLSAGQVSDAMEARLEALASEVRALRELLLDPERLRDAAEKLIQDESGGEKRRRRRSSPSSSR